MFCALGIIFDGALVRRVLFSCFAPGLIFGDVEGVGSHFHFLCSWTRFRRYRERQVLFSCFALPESFSAAPRASGPIFLFCALGLFFDGPEGVVPIFMFYALGLVFGGIEGFGSRFHVLRARTHFRRCMFCAPCLIFGSIVGVGSRFHVLPARTRFRRYRGCPVPFSSFALPD
jgi:hypothetical protein